MPSFFHPLPLFSVPLHLECPLPGTPTTLGGLGGQLYQMGSPGPFPKARSTSPGPPLNPTSQAPWISGDGQAAVGVAPCTSGCPTPGPCPAPHSVAMLTSVDLLEVRAGRNDTGTQISNSAKAQETVWVPGRACSWVTGRLPRGQVRRPRPASAFPPPSGKGVSSWPQGPCQQRRARLSAKQGPPSRSPK